LHEYFVSKGVGNAVYYRHWKRHRTVPSPTPIVKALKCKNSVKVLLYDRKRQRGNGTAMGTNQYAFLKVSFLRVLHCRALFLFVLIILYSLYLVYNSIRFLSLSG
jgi:hypothetical protein